MSEEFFIGWQGKAPEKTGRFLKGITLVLIVTVLVLAAVVPSLQETVAKDANFDFGKETAFEGILLKNPVPMLIGADNQIYYLVNPLKFGFDPKLAAEFHLNRVSLRGTRIWREDEEMIEVVPNSIERTGDPAPARHPLGRETELGEVTLEGEIVDSKCYLGVMNPGNLKPHRACAVNCIQGGIPPVFLVRDEDGRASYLLLVDEQGRALNEHILKLVAEPVQATGKLKKLGKQLILYANPDRILLKE